MTTTSGRGPRRFLVVRAAATPLLFLGLVVGAWIGVGAGRLTLDAVNTNEPTPFSGMAAFALGVVSLAGLTTAANCGVGLWLFWRRKRRVE